MSRASYHITSALGFVSNNIQVESSRAIKNSPSRHGQDASVVPRTTWNPGKQTQSFCDFQHEAFNSQPPTQGRQIAAEHLEPRLHTIISSCGTSALSLALLIPLDI